MRAIPKSVPSSHIQCYLAELGQQQLVGHLGFPLIVDALEHLLGYEKAPKSVSNLTVNILSILGVSCQFGEVLSLHRPIKLDANLCVNETSSGILAEADRILITTFKVVTVWMFMMT